MNFQKIGTTLACVVLTIATLALGGCNSSEPPRPTTAKTMELQNTDLFGTEYTYLGDVAIYMVNETATDCTNETIEDGEFVGSFTSDETTPPTETMFLLEGRYCAVLTPDSPMCSVSTENSWSCDTPEHFNNFVGCSFVSVEDNPFDVLAPFSNTPVTLNFRAGYNENVCPPTEDDPSYVEALCGCLEDSEEEEVCESLFDQDTCEMNVPNELISSSATFAPEFLPGEVCSNTDATQCTEGEQCLTFDGGVTEACHSECAPAVDCEAPPLVCASTDCEVGEDCRAFGLEVGDLLSEAVYVCVEPPPL